MMARCVPVARVWLPYTGTGIGRAAPGTFDANSSSFEAVLIVPGQACGYRIYDSLGKDHLERTFDRLRFAAAR